MIGKNLDVDYLVYNEIYYMQNIF
ncbi:uncharacterized protein METZ01_LOCUS250597 [marine metagenome]|uniref:Uncharacterized protein n=1 Tax=marine metagenome TaxID=408172 RepID=A0A382IFQ5_9ZZZZ